MSELSNLKSLVESQQANLVATAKERDAALEAGEAAMKAAKLHAQEERAALEEVAFWVKKHGRTEGELNKALEEVERLGEALIAMRELAVVANDGDPWYAEHEGVDAGRAFALARAALAESPQEEK